MAFRRYYHGCNNSSYYISSATARSGSVGLLTRNPRSSQTEIASDNPGGLNGSMQHWLAVYPPEFQIPMFFVAVD